MKFSTAYTFNNYKFYCAVLDSNKYMLMQHEDIFHNKQKSLTNNIEEVLDHIICGISIGSSYKHYEFFQISNDGIFKLRFDVSGASLNKNKYSRNSFNIKWQFITKNIKNFNILYGNTNEI